MFNLSVRVKTISKRQIFHLSKMLVLLQFSIKNLINNAVNTFHFGSWKIVLLFHFHLLKSQKSSVNEWRSRLQFPRDFLFNAEINLLLSKSKKIGKFGHGATSWTEQIVGFLTLDLLTPNCNFTSMLVIFELWI